MHSNLFQFVFISLVLHVIKYLNVKLTINLWNWTKTIIEAKGPKLTLWKNIEPFATKGVQSYNSAPQVKFCSQLVPFLLFFWGFSHKVYFFHFSSRFYLIFVFFKRWEVVSGSWMNFINISSVFLSV